MSLLPTPWTDESSFSQGTKDRTPCTWRAKFGCFRLVLTRHIDHADDEWIASCYGVFERVTMQAKDVGEAALEAKLMLKHKLLTAISHIDTE